MNFFYTSKGQLRHFHWTYPDLVARPLSTEYLGLDHAEVSPEQLQTGEEFVGVGFAPPVTGVFADYVAITRESFVLLVDPFAACSRCFDDFVLGHCLDFVDDCLSIDDFDSRLGASLLFPRWLLGCLLLLFLLVLDRLRFDGVF